MICVVVVTAILLASGHRTHANGLNAIAIGFEAYAMGGADVAVARDPFALNSNPAGLAQLDGQRFEQHGMLLHALDTYHADAFNVRHDVTNQWLLIGNVGVSYALPDMPVTVGAMLAAQGGAGFKYSDLQTAFGTIDRLKSIVGVAKGTVGAAWRVNDRLSLGVGLNIFYANANQKVFPETSFFNAANPAASFFGTELQNARAFNVGVKAGALYRLSDAVTLGAAYTGPTSLRLTGADMIVNYSALGLGKVTYRDVTITGLNQAQQVDVGIAWQATSWLLLSIKGSWINWSSAMRQSSLLASDPDNPAATSVIANSGTFGWRDQYVFALGGAYDLDAQTKLYAGVNLATNPVVAEHASPLLGGWSRTHLTGGVRRQLNERWHMSVGFEYLPNQHLSYTNSELPFLPGTRDNNHYVGLLTALGARW
jgi:long-chain fatty acid transport protein